MKFRPRVKFRNRVKFRPSFVTLGGCAACYTEVLRPGGSVASSEQINPGGYAARNNIGVLFVVPSHAVGRPIMKSMLISIVLAIRHGSSSVILLKLIKQKEVEHFILIANYRICTIPCHADSCWLLMHVRR